MINEVDLLEAWETFIDGLGSYSPEEKAEIRDFIKLLIIANREDLTGRVASLTMVSKASRLESLLSGNVELKNK